MMDLLLKNKEEALLADRHTILGSLYLCVLLLAQLALLRHYLKLLYIHKGLGLRGFGVLGFWGGGGGSW